MLMRAPKGLLTSIKFLLLFTLALASCTLDPRSRSEGRLQKGKKHMESSGFREAVTEFKNAVQADPSSAEARYNLALGVYMRLGKPSNVTAAFRELSTAFAQDQTGRYRCPCGERSL